MLLIDQIQYLLHFLGLLNYLPRTHVRQVSLSQLLVGDLASDSFYLVFDGVAQDVVFNIEAGRAMLQIWLVVGRRFELSF